MNELVSSKDLRQQAKELIASGFLPQHIKTVDQFMAIAMKGQEVGLPPMQAVSQINMIQGKPTISSEAMLALVFKSLPTCDIAYRALTNEECVIEARRSPDGQYSKFSFSMSDARLAGISSKDNWKKYPRAMLKARCISEMCRSLFPDCIAGISYTPEEIEVQPLKPKPQPPREIQSIPHNEPMRTVTMGEVVPDPTEEEINIFLAQNQESSFDQYPEPTLETKPSLQNLAEKVSVKDVKDLVEHCKKHNIPNDYVKTILNTEFGGVQSKDLMRLQYNKLMKMLEPKPKDKS